MSNHGHVEHLERAERGLKVYDHLWQSPAHPRPTRRRRRRVGGFGLLCVLEHVRKIDTVAFQTGKIETV